MREINIIVTADLNASTEGRSNKKEGRVFHYFRVLVKKLYL